MKFFYYYGIYMFCVGLNRSLRSIPKILDDAKLTARKIRQIKDVANGKEEEMGFRPRKVVNKIGF